MLERKISKPKRKISQNFEISVVFGGSSITEAGYLEMYSHSCSRHGFTRFLHFQIAGVL